MHSLLLFTCQQANMARLNVKTILISGVRIGGPTLAFWLRAVGFGRRLSSVLRGCAPALSSTFGVSVTTLLCTWGRQTISNAQAHCIGISVHARIRRHRRKSRSEGDLVARFPAAVLPTARKSATRNSTIAAPTPRRWHRPGIGRAPRRRQGAGFVQQQQLRIEDQRASDRKHLLFAAG